MPERLAQGVAFGLQFLTDLKVLLPGGRELLDADLLEPRLAPVDDGADELGRDRQVLVTDLRVGVEARVELAGPPLNLLRNIGDVGQALLVLVRPVMGELDQVRPRAARLGSICCW